MTKSKAEKELDDYEAAFSALAHEDRRRILVVLLGRGGTMTAGDIVQRFRSSWPTMTRHLQTLEAAGLIKVEKVGRERHYVLNSGHMRRVLCSWLKWFPEENHDE